ncbi:unnamed protein product [Ceutorhynchus assimilis]|uniref:CCHC-type domain-containing protein n=1 Tax=Ceutorhynchus assimilis TaxID=467358 RepID=A0A9N9MH33_9CUCU|nr:unnamed protein product [Ceutorhynchus assimilis]
MKVASKSNSFQDTLRDVKEALKGKEEGKCLQGIRSTKEEKLLITMNKNQTAAENLQKLLRTKDNGIGKKYKILEDRRQAEIVLIRGIDPLVEKEEFMDLLKEIIDDMENKIVNLSDLRPTADNTQSVSLNINKKRCRKIIRSKGDQNRTNKMQGGKKDQDAAIQQMLAVRPINNRPDRSKLCHNWGKEGHLQEECKEEINCPICERAGYRYRYLQEQNREMKKAVQGIR